MTPTHKKLDKAFHMIAEYRDQETQRADEAIEELQKTTEELARVRAHRIELIQKGVRMRRRLNEEEKAIAAMKRQRNRYKDLFIETGEENESLRHHLSTRTKERDEALTELNLLKSCDREDMEYWQKRAMETSYHLIESQKECRELRPRVGASTHTTPGYLPPCWDPDGAHQCQLMESDDCAGCGRKFL